MNSFNAVGRLGRDPETRFTKGGKAVSSLAIAVDSGWGENKKTTWLDGAFWGKDGQEHGLVKHLSKGSQIAVTGEITLETFDKNDGTKGFSLKLYVQNLTPIGGSNSKSEPQPEKTESSTSEKIPAFADDDMPF